MTKEEVISQQLGSMYHSKTADELSQFHLCMDEYAKQQAIAFDEWKRKNKWFSFENNEYWYQIFEVGTSRAHTLTSEQLYDQFIEQQNK